MIELRQNSLVLSVPEVHRSAKLSIDFQRTLRIPDDNKEHSLPAGLGRFPLEHVEDHAARLPKAWAEHGGVLMPMYQAEALWINFSEDGYPFAIKIAAGKINAVTGKTWKQPLKAEPQDYVTVPGQPWLDGFCVKKGQIRQFVAMPLGAGYTAEEQITGKAEHGGVQIVAYPMKAEAYKKYRAAQRSVHRIGVYELAPQACMSPSYEMGLAPGGLMRQEIYDDDFGFDAWDQDHAVRCFVHILNSQQWAACTGKPMPQKPISAQDYQRAGVPWFDYYDDSLAAVDGSKILAGLDSVAALGVKKGEQPLPDEAAGQLEPTLVLGPKP